MMKPAVTVALLALPWFAVPALADTQTATADTLVVVTPNAPIVVTQGSPASVAPMLQPPGAAEMPPAPPAAHNGAPQNEPWSNVSHINGVPVKVGERGDYLYRFRKTNIQVNPFGPFFGLYDMSATHALGQNLAASVAITAVEDMFQLSATLPLYFRRTYSGPFLEGGLLYRAELYDVEPYAYSGGCYDCSYEYDNSWVGPQLMFGWHWSFDSGLNISFAFGFAKRMDQSNEYNDDPEGNGYFRVGYAF